MVVGDNGGTIVTSISIGPSALQEGFSNLWNWFDEHTWYPLGRVIGGTVYPVRQQLRNAAAGLSHSFLRRHLRNICATVNGTMDCWDQLILCTCALQGIIFTAGATWNFLQAINLPVHVQEVRVVSCRVDLSVFSRSRAGHFSCSTPMMFCDQACMIWQANPAGLCLHSSTVLGFLCSGYLLLRKRGAAFIWHLTLPRMLHDCCGAAVPGD